MSASENTWHNRFVLKALLLATFSKYPGHKVGCVIADDDHNQLSAGYNGFPRGIADDDRLKDRDTALKIVVHAEANAVAAAARNGHSLKGATLYSTLRPCPQCASLIIQAGIKRVVSIAGQNEDRWKELFDFAENILIEAGVEVLKA